MAITVYSSLDAGAPVLPSVSSQRLIDNLRLILKACLVDGYAGKPAAGWTVGHDVADGFSLSNGEGFINFVHNATTSVVAYIMEAITDPTTALAGGYNRRSGPWFDGESTTSRQFIYNTGFSGAAASKQWVVVADDKTAVICFAGGSTTVPDVAVNYAGGLYFGRYLPYSGGTGFCCLGGGASATATMLMTSTATNVGTTLRNPFSGAVVQGAAPGYRVSLAADNANPTVRNRTTFYVNHLRLFRAVMLGVGVGVSGSTTAADGVNCGLLRGILQDPSLGDTRLSQTLQALGVSSPSYDDRVRPLTLPNGQQVVPLYPHTADGGLLISLDPADWS